MHPLTLTLLPTASNSGPATVDAAPTFSAGSSLSLTAGEPSPLGGSGSLSLNPRSGRMVVSPEDDSGEGGEPPAGDDFMDRVRGRDPEALSRLIALVEAELRRVAHNKLKGEKRGISVRTTALVNDAIMKIVGKGIERLRDREHFRRAVIRAMKNILIDRARRKRLDVDPEANPDDVLIDRTIKHIEVSRGIEFEDFILTLEDFAKDHPELAEIVRMKVFLEMTNAAIAREFDYSEKTVDRRWEMARLLLWGRLR